MMSCLELSFTVRIPTAIVPRAIKIMSQKYGDFDEYSTFYDINVGIKRQQLKMKCFAKDRFAQTVALPKQKMQSNL